MAFFAALGHCPAAGTRPASTSGDWLCQHDCSWLPSVVPLSRRYRSHRPSSPRQCSLPGSLCSASRSPPNLDPNTLAAPGFLPAALTTPRSSPALPPAHPPACNSTAPPDSSAPAAHTLHPPSALPTNSPPSPRFVPGTTPPALPAPLPSPADSALTGSLAHSPPDNSAAPLHTPPPRLPDSVPPVPRKVPSRISHTPPTPLPSRSIPQSLASALPSSPTTGCCGDSRCSPQQTAVHGRSSRSNGQSVLGQNGMRCSEAPLRSAGSRDRPQSERQRYGWFR